jgi:topoisomerase-4 subunit B
MKTGSKKSTGKPVLSPTKKTTIKPASKKTANSATKATKAAAAAKTTAKPLKKASIVKKQSKPPTLLKAAKKNTILITAKRPAKAEEVLPPVKRVTQASPQKKTTKSNANSISLQKGKNKDMAELLNDYTEDSIKSLDWREHIRLRPGMYIGKLGDGSSMDDGIYILVKEVMDNCIDEYTMGHGKRVDLSIKDGIVTVRDYGRGIPLGKVVDVVSKINTGAKYDSKAFQKSVGLNGVGTKAVNALSAFFRVTAFREGRMKTAEFEKGHLTKEYKESATTENNGTLVTFTPDDTVFKHYHFIPEYVENQIWNYCFLNAGLLIHFNGRNFVSKNGLLDLLQRKTNPEIMRYPIIHLKAEDIEVALTHTGDYGEDLYSFVNGQHTTQGGTHQGAFREAFVKVIRDFFKKDYEASDVRQSICAAISVRVQEPVFESQTKTKLGSQYVWEGGPSMKSFITDFLAKELDNYLHKNPSVADAMKKRIEQSERERKELSGIRKLANERAKKANLHNKKLRDCRIHLNDEPPAKNKELFDQKRLESTVFITEGDSASGSITKSRNVESQAVFSLRGKPLNSYGLTKKVVYENEEFNLLQHALNIEEGLEGLRYNNIVIATDADVDGMHIRLLIMTFFLQFFPDLVKNGHVFILDTPLFRVRNKQKTIYCYSEDEKQKAVKELGNKPEITRFKGLGEISPDEFARFIGEDMRKEPVLLNQEEHIQKLLEYYMGKNTPGRQVFIIDNLKVEKDIVEDLN